MPTFKLPFVTLLLLISFAAVNAVMYTPALPEMAAYFAISDGAAQLTITTFLVGYAVGQLFYGPLANRYGRKRAIYIGVLIQILSSIACILAGIFHHFSILVFSRFALALGAGVGLKITITMVNECYSPQQASRILSLLMLAFAITPGLGVAIGGLLTTYWGWMSCFYAAAIYGIVLFILCTRLPETQVNLNYQALQPSYLLKGYARQFTSPKVLVGGALVGMCSCCIYIFAALGPFIAIELAGMSSEQYGFANLIPLLGLGLGSIASAKLTNHYPILSIIKFGVIVTVIGVILMSVLVYLHLPIMASIFIPMLIINFGEILILPNASSRAMSFADDKSNAASVLNFIAVGLATVAVLSLSFMTVTLIVMPLIYGMIAILSIILYKLYS